MGKKGKNKLKKDKKGKKVNYGIKERKKTDLRINGNEGKRKWRGKWRERNKWRGKGREKKKKKRRKQKSERRNGEEGKQGTGTKNKKKKEINHKETKTKHR